MPTVRQQPAVRLGEADDLRVMPMDATQDLSAALRPGRRPLDIPVNQSQRQDRGSLPLGTARQALAAPRRRQQARASGRGARSFAQGGVSGRQDGGSVAPYNTRGFRLALGTMLVAYLKPPVARWRFHSSSSISYRWASSSHSPRSSSSCRTPHWAIDRLVVFRAVRSIALLSSQRSGFRNPYRLYPESSAETCGTLMNSVSNTYAKSLNAARWPRSFCIPTVRSLRLHRSWA